MITWLQALIEKRGKWLFIVLLAIVIVSFVPYISPTGSSSLDFFSEESQRGQDQYFGYDWYNPNDQRLLNVSYQASTSMGTSIVPEEEVVIAAAEKFRQSLPGMAQAAFQAGQQEQAQELFGLWQQWGGIPLEQKARIITSMPASSSEFTRGVMEAKIALLQIGASWELLPLALENGDIVKAFRKFLAARVDNRLGITQDGELDPAKYELVVNNFASALNLQANQVQAILFEDFRADQVDAVLRTTGFALPLEGQLDLRGNDLLWKCQALSLDAEKFEPEPLAFATIRLLSLPENNATLTLKYENSTYTLTFRETLPANPKNGDVAIGKGESKAAQLLSTRDNLKIVLAKTVHSYVVREGEDDNGSQEPVLRLSLPSAGVPFEMPRVDSSSAAFSITNELEDELIAYYETHKEEERFLEPARTAATALEFHYQKYLKEPTSPTEAELRSYFELHPGEFTRPAKQATESSPPVKSPQSEASPTEDGRKGPRGLRGRPSVRASRVPKKEKDEPPAAPPNKEEPTQPATPPVPAVQPEPEPDAAKPLPNAKPAVASGSLVENNATQVAETNATSSAEESKEPEPEPPVTFEEVRQQVLDRVLEERRLELESEARDLAEKRAEDFISELHNLSRSLTEQGGDALQMRQDPSIEALIKGFQLSDKKAVFSSGEVETNARVTGLPADALRDMLDLPSHRFFSEATYETDYGFAVMLLDARMEASSKDFAAADFRVLVREFRTERKQEAFQARGEELAETLRKGLETGTPLAELSSQVDSTLAYHEFEGDDADSIGQRFEKRSRKLDRKVNKAQADLNKLVELTKDRNATSAEQTAINDLRDGIKELRDQRGLITDERGLAEDILAVASDEDSKSGEITGMVTGKSTKDGLFVLLQEIILEVDDEEKTLVEQRIESLERRRSSENRENLLSDWIEKGRKSP